MTLMSKTLIAACASLLLAGSALAQTSAPATSPAPAAKSAPAKPAMAKPERSATSLDCSKQADAKGLHGKERHKFRAECKKGAGKAK